MSYEIPTDDEYIINAQRKAKKGFLQEEVVNGGLDPEAFTNFAASSKGTTEIDIDMFTFEELQEMVRNFKTHVREEARRAKL